ncbi:unnamed protein product [Euphydryas editha]|uniref:Proton-coupled folate transporter n=1 Tax=Euphydryas editha TaxID=104508 RepID=A0AAU9TYQ3_EUPED|nr:unnamed protein product [Euphydryas editha]
MPDDNEPRSEDVSLPVSKRSIATTIELPLFLNLLALSLTGPAISNIVLYKTCVHSLNYTVPQCKPFLSPIKTNETALLEKDVEKYSTYVSTVKLVLEYIFPAFLSLFLGAWSDTYGRKPLIVWPLFGASITGMLLVIFSLMDSLGPWWYILTAVPSSLSGGYIAMFTGMYCYVSDTSTPDSTSLRMTMIDATTSLGIVIGSVLCTYFILTIGTTYLLLLAATISVIAYSFSNIWIKESLSGALQGGGSKILDLLLIKEMFNESLKERPNHQRTQIFLICIVSVNVILAYTGPLSVEYLYTRQKLQWSLQEYTTYSSFSTALTLVGGFFGVLVVQKALRLGDIGFSIAVLILIIANNMIKMFAVETWHMYLACAMSIFRGLPGPLMRSYLTKILPVEDVGKVFVLLSTSESICPVLFPLIFNPLYSYTLSTFPGAIYALSSGLVFIAMILLGYVQYFSWLGSSTNYRRLDSVNEEN